MEPVAVVVDTECAAVKEVNWVEDRGWFIVEHHGIAGDSELYVDRTAAPPARPVLSTLTIRAGQPPGVASRAPDGNPCAMRHPPTRRKSRTFPSLPGNEE